MPSENQDLVKRAYAHWAETGDIFEQALHPDARWQTRSDLPDSDVYVGIDAIRGLIQGWPSAFEEFGAEIQDVTEVGEHVVVSMVLRGRIRSGGEEVVMSETHVWTVRDGKVSQVREYATRDAALEALASPP